MYPCTRLPGIARWGKAELQRSYLARTLRKLPRPQTAPTAGTPQLAPGDTRAIFALLQDCRRQVQDGLTRELQRIDELTGKLSGRIDRINWVAVRQCHYTSISAQIEAAQVSAERTGLAAVAADIRALADDIAQAERRAKERAVELRHLLKSKLPMLKKQVRHD